MENIVINGINLNDLNAQIQSIRQEASSLISENIELAQNLTKRIVESDNKEQIEDNAKQAYAALQKASFISDVSGVPFNLRYNSSYSGYHDDDTLSAMLEDHENEVLNELFDKIPELHSLLNLACDMEYQSKHWDASVC